MVARTRGRCFGAFGLSNFGPASVRLRFDSLAIQETYFLLSSLSLFCNGFILYVRIRKKGRSNGKGSR